MTLKVPTSITIGEKVSFMSVTGRQLSVGKITEISDGK